MRVSRTRPRPCTKLQVLSRPQQAPDTLENLVKLDYDGRQERISLFDGRIQLSAVKEAFGLSTVKINGRIEPVNDKGFTMTRFPPQSTVKVTGQPTSEMACLFGEIAALRHDIHQLQELRCDLKDSAGLRAELAELKRDLTATKRLVAEIVAVGVTSHKTDSPDFTKTSQDGYTFDTWWEAQCLARDIISGHTQVRPDKSSDLPHPDDDIVATGLHHT